MLDQVIIEEIKRHNSDPAAIPWVLDFLEQALPPNPDRNLLPLLIGIGCNAYNTTFIDDYDLSPDDLKLSELRDLPRDQIDQCLEALMRKSTAFFIPTYVAEFERKYFPASKAA
jgi:hypothetical protein